MVGRAWNGMKGSRKTGFGGVISTQATTQKHVSVIAEFPTHVFVTSVFLLVIVTALRIKVDEC
jgi:hypothetical protein